MPELLGLPCATLRKGNQYEIKIDLTALQKTQFVDRLARQTQFFQPLYSERTGNQSGLKKIGIMETKNKKVTY